MNENEIKRQVSSVVEASWRGFAEEHPALAQVIDQTMLCEHVVESLARDEEFTDAYARAVSAGIGMEVFSETLARFVNSVLRRLT